MHRLNITPPWGSKAQWKNTATTFETRDPRLKTLVLLTTNWKRSLKSDWVMSAKRMRKWKSRTLSSPSSTSLLRRYGFTKLKLISAKYLLQNLIGETKKTAEHKQLIRELTSLAKDQKAELRELHQRHQVTVALFEVSRKWICLSESMLICYRKNHKNQTLSNAKWRSSHYLRTIWRPGTRTWRQPWIIKVARLMRSKARVKLYSRKFMIWYVV